MALKNVLERIRDTAEDIVTLDVVTLSGTLELKLAAGAGGDNPLELKKLYKKLEESSTAGNMEVVAYTHIDFDKDAVNFVKQGLGEADLPLVQAHNEMVKTAQEGRLAIIRAVKEMVGIVKPG